MKSRDTQLFFFSFDAVPTSASSQATDLAGAEIHVWVTDKSMDSAESMARQCIMDFAWIVQGVSVAKHCPLERILQLDEEEQVLVLRAIKEGIAADFLAWPKDGIIADDYSQLRIPSVPSPGSQLVH
jgi:hypothetical protein